MRVGELIEILKEQPAEAEVELAIVAPVGDDKEDITVDRYSVYDFWPWLDNQPDDDNEDGLVIWLVGGEDEDVEFLFDALEHPDE